MIKAITLWQPWASMIAYHGKKIETRSRTTHYRGWVLIHAAQSFPMERQILLDQPPFRQVFGDQFGITMMNAVHYTVPRGAVHAAARLVDVIPTDRLRRGQVIEAAGRMWRLDDQEYEAGNYDDGRYGLLLADVVRLTRPVQARGSQLLLWTPKAETVAAVERDLLGVADHGCAKWHDLPDDWPKEWPK